MVIAALLLSSAGIAAPARSAELATSGIHHTSIDRVGAGSGGHEGAEGLRLAAASRESVGSGSGCSGGGPVRSYDVVAINVDITVNRFGDHDPRGRMYVLTRDLNRVRAEEAANARANRDGVDAPVSLGLADDAIQPLVVRVNPGECLRLSLRNDLADEPASIHIHGSSLRVRGGGPAIASNRMATAAPGKRVDYEWHVPSNEPEGTHYVHSHGDAREQTSHGLFGAVIVEPVRSEHLNPLTGRPLTSGWSAVIRAPKQQAFREFALLYHEIGNETYQLTDRNGAFIPLVDPLLGAYRPASRAINFRSEPFMNRMSLQKTTFGRFDESLAYSSYSFGDPATPIMRTYLGERTKQRVLHAGSEVFHVHHVHGGSIRWRRQPGLAPTEPTGLLKRPPILPGPSERTDSQSIGPAESFDVENECGAGGCQQGAGDFLFHCHVAHHYFSGMWGIWRVYNTEQDGSASTDALLPLAAISGTGSDQVEPAIPSSRLLGRAISGLAQPFTVDGTNLAAWVERQLPPRGTRSDADASLFDWSRTGDDYVGEAETTTTWPGHRPRSPGARTPLLFDPRTGKLAYPFLAPHLGRRPPFAPGHGPAPYLDPAGSAHEPPPPGASGPASVCPSGTRLKQLGITALPIPVALNSRTNLVDPNGEVFALTRDIDAVRVNPNLRRPLAIRANAGEDCIDVVFRSALEDNDINHGFAKVDMHIHFVQFDVQGSDGLTAGFNYEQAVRPYTIEGEPLVAAAAAGMSDVTVRASARFAIGALVGVGLERDREFEARSVVAIHGSTLVLDGPLEFAHSPGETVSTEFVRYRWYPDAQVGTAYFHDHVNGLESWRHGLTGALIVEPPGSTYHDPTTGAEIDSGPVADVRTSRPFGVDVKGDFRELATFIQDDIPLTSIGRSSGSVMNLRAEPLASRPGDPALRFSSAVYGDPATPVLRAFVGDPLVFRNLVSGTNDVHSWHLDGHWFRVEPHSATSPPVNTVNIGISERFDVGVAAAGGPQRRSGDYLYYSGRSSKLAEGSWGILRVLEPGAADLQALPDRKPVAGRSGSVCPPQATHRRFDIAALAVPLPMLGDAIGKLFVLERNVADIASGRKRPEPLVLRVNVGDCIDVRLTNRLAAGPVSFHTDLLAADPMSSAGVAAGNNPKQAVDPGNTGSFEFYADPTVGEVTAMVRDFADAEHNTAVGLYGAIVVAPRNATFSDPTTGDDVSAQSTWRADVRVPGGRSYRDVALFIQDEDAGIGTHRMPYTARVAGVVGLNYSATPLGDNPKAELPAPTTPLIEAYAGDPVRVHVLAPWNEQAHVFAVEGHRWSVEPGRRGADLVDAAQLGGLNTLNLDLEGGAGGPEHLAGDYVYGDHREPYREAGLWGIFRVHPSCSQRALRPLNNRCGTTGRLWIAAFGSAALLLIGLLAWRRHRRVRRAALAP